MRHLIWLAIVLLALYAVLTVTKWVVGGFLHLLWIGAVIFFVVWLVGRIRGRGTRLP